MSINVHSLGSRGQRLTKYTYFSLLTQTKQLLIVKFCDKTAEIEPRFRTRERTDKQMNGRKERYLDVKVEIVI